MSKSGGQVVTGNEQDEILGWEARAGGRPPLCPNGACLCSMRPDTDARCDHASFQPVVCLHCGQRGVVATNGVLVLFGFRHEFVIGYGLSLSTMTVKVSEAAVILFGQHGLTPNQIAAYAAEWALLSGCTTGILRLSADQPTLTACYEHFRRSVLDPGLGSGSVRAA
jgi:hypothetical protein